MAALQFAQSEIEGPARANESRPVHPENRPERGRAATRADLVDLAIQLDAAIARAERLGLDMTAYLVGVARADVAERLGERRTAKRSPSED